MVGFHWPRAGARGRAMAGALVRPLRGKALLVAPRRAQEPILVLACVMAFIAAVAVTVGGIGASHPPVGAGVAAAEVQRGRVAPHGAGTAAAPGGSVLAGFTGGLSAGTTATTGTPAATRAPVATLAPPSQLASGGIPSTALSAYRNAATLSAAKDPRCHLPWPLLAGIGRVESNHGRFAGAVLHSDGVSTPRIIGIPLNGNGTALIRDTDHGRLDGDTVYDHAVGPMQFIPSTWAGWGRDANHDGVRDPFNIIDAAAAAADYLCAAGRDLGTYAGQVAAVLSYNHSDAYVAEVLGLEKIYATQVGVTIPVLPTDPTTHPATHGRRPTLPPVDPGPPRALIPPARTPASPSGTTGSTPATPSGHTTSDAPTTGAGSPTIDPGDPIPPGTSTDQPSDPADPTDPPTDTTSPDPVDPSTDAPTGDSTDAPAAGADAGTDGSASAGAAVTGDAAGSDDTATT